MKGGKSFFCPVCSHRQSVGDPGEMLALPMKVKCEECGAAIVLELSQSGGIHPVAEGSTTG